MLVTGHYQRLTTILSILNLLFGVLRATVTQSPFFLEEFLSTPFKPDRGAQITAHLLTEILELFKSPAIAK